MNNPILIGLTGKRGSGKNTVGEIIKEWAQENGQKAQLQGFADSLKLSFARIFVPDATLEEALAFADSMKENGELSFSTPLYQHDLFHKFGENRVISGRAALQHYGTEAHRKVFDDDFWVNQLLPLGGGDHGENIKWIGKWGFPNNTADFAVITDLRFSNEAQRVNDLGGAIFRVDRPSLDSQIDSHASEKLLEDGYIKSIIENNSSLNDLRENVWRTMDYYYGVDVKEKELKEYGFAPAHSELAVGVGA